MEYKLEAPGEHKVNLRQGGPSQLSLVKTTQNLPDWSSYVQLSTKFHKDLTSNFTVVLLRDKQTDKQTHVNIITPVADG